MIFMVDVLVSTW